MNDNLMLVLPIQMFIFYILKLIHGNIIIFVYMLFYMALECNVFIVQMCFRVVQNIFYEHLQPTEKLLDKIWLPQYCTLLS